MCKPLLNPLLSYGSRESVKLWQVNTKEYRTGIILLLPVFNASKHAFSLLPHLFWKFSSSFVFLDFTISVDVIHHEEYVYSVSTAYWYCQMKKNEWLWTFWKRNDYENFEKGGVVEKREEEETKSMPHAPVCWTWI